MINNLSFSSTITADASGNFTLDYAAPTIVSTDTSSFGVLENFGDIIFFPLENIDASSFLPRPLIPIFVRHFVSAPFPATYEITYQDNNPLDPAGQNGLNAEYIETVSCWSRGYFQKHWLLDTDVTEHFTYRMKVVNSSFESPLEPPSYSGATAPATTNLYVLDENVLGQIHGNITSSNWPIPCVHSGATCTNSLTICAHDVNSGQTDYAHNTMYITQDASLGLNYLINSKPALTIKSDTTFDSGNFLFLPTNSGNLYSAVFSHVETQTHGAQLYVYVNTLTKVSFSGFGTCSRGESGSFTYNGQIYTINGNSPNGPFPNSNGGQVSYTDLGESITPIALP